MKGQVKNAVTTAKAVEAAKNAPRILERVTTRQVEAIKIHRRAGLKEQEIADLMGISLSSVSRHSRGIKPDVPLPDTPQERSAFSKSLPDANGGERPVLDSAKPSIIQIGVELDAELMLMLAGTASVQGYSSLKEYLKSYALPWLTTLKQAQELIGSSSPTDHVAKLTEIVKGYVAYNRLVAETKKEAEKSVIKRDGQQGTTG